MRGPGPSADVVGELVAVLVAIGAVDECEAVLVAAGDVRESQSVTTGSIYIDCCIALF